MHGRRYAFTCTRLKHRKRAALRMAGNDEVVTFGELERRSNHIAHLFRDLRLRAGDHIALLMENQRRFLEVCLAAQRSGLLYTAITSSRGFASG